MAKGGWTYSYSVVEPFTDSLAGWQAAFGSIGPGLVANAAGWLEEDPLTKYDPGGASAYGWWWQSWMNQNSGAAPTGSITVTGMTGADLVDNETFQINDGRNPVVTFIFDSDGDVVETDTDRAVNFLVGYTDGQIRDALITAITNAPTLNVNATIGGAAVVTLTNTRVGTVGNTDLSTNELVTDPGFVVSGFTGGVDGARLAMIVTGDNSPSGTMLTAANNQSNQTITTFETAQHLAFAYYPPGGSGWGAANPGVTGFIPNDCFRFGIDRFDTDAVGIMDWNAGFTGGQTVFHWVCKDDDICILVEIRSDASRGLDLFWGFGTLLDTLAHPTANLIPDLTNEACIGCLNGISALNSGDSPYGFWQQGYWADPTDRLARRARCRFDGAALTWLGTGQSTNLHSFGAVGLEPWVSPFMYISRSGDLDTQGIVPGNGMKGVLDPEKIRRVQGYLLSQRQTLDGGNFIYIGGNIAIGWDPANTPMY